MNYKRKDRLIYLPREVLVHIFSFYVETEGISPLINNLSRVNDLWEDASKDLKLYKVIDDPNLSKDMLLNLVEELSHTYHLNLSYITTLTSENIKEILSHCSKLRTLHAQMKKSEKSLLADNLLKTLPKLCPMLENLSLHDYKLTSPNTNPFLETLGPRLKHLNLNRNFFVNFSTTMKSIASWCPLLEELYLCGITGISMTFPFKDFQTSCPNLRTLELEDVEFSPTSKITAGFPNLECFTFRVIHKFSITSSFLNNILKHSTKLKFLDLRGNAGLSFFTVESDCLETLYLSRTNISSCTLRWVLKRWKHSLKNLDLSMWHGEAALNFSLDELINEKEPNSKLEVLNLCGSPITNDTLTKVLIKCPNLEYLNIESCRGLQRGIKRIYRTKGNVNILREYLLQSGSDKDIRLPRFSDDVYNMDVKGEKLQQFSDSDYEDENDSDYRAWLKVEEGKWTQSSDDKLVKKRKKRRKFGDDYDDDSDDEDDSDYEDKLQKKGRKRRQPSNDKLAKKKKKAKAV